MKIKYRKKRLFIFYGLINVLITNFILQAILFIIPVIFATLISQLFNFLFGFYFYSKKVFKVNLLNNSQVFKYLIMHIFLWKINWFLIEFISSDNLSKNISSLLVIPPLACASYLCQKLFIFNERN